MLKWIIAAACLCSTMVQAQSSTLSGQQISDLVAGATVEIDTPIGSKLPVRYTRDGKLSGEAGDLASYLGAAFDKGRWWVASDQLCHKWNRWFGSEPQCIQLSKQGRLLHWRSQDGYTGTAMISVPATIQAGAVAPRAEPERAKQTPPPEMPSAPANAHEERPAEPASKSAEQPAQELAQQAAAPPPAADAAAADAPAAKAPAAAADAGSSPQPQAAPQRGTQPMFRVVNVRSDDVLNVRSGPSADFDIVGRLPPGSRGIAITKACRAEWCPVQHRSTNGWVNSAYLAPEEGSSLPRYSRRGFPEQQAADGRR